MTGWQRTERWFALGSFITGVAALIGWVGEVVTAAGAWSLALLLLSVATTAFDWVWVTRPSAMSWWSGLVVFLVAVAPACSAFITLPGAIAHVAGLFTLVSSALACATVIRRYEMPPLGR